MRACCSAGSLECRSELRLENFPKFIEVDDGIRSSFPPHSEHVFVNTDPIGWIASVSAPHDSHLYS